MDVEEFIQFQLDRATAGRIAGSVEQSFKDEAVRLNTTLKFNSGLSEKLIQLGEFLASGPVDFRRLFTLEFSTPQGFEEKETQRAALNTKELGQSLWFAGQRQAKELSKSISNGEENLTVLKNIVGERDLQRRQEKQVSCNPSRDNKSFKNGAARLVGVNNFRERKVDQILKECLDYVRKSPNKKDSLSSVLIPAVVESLTGLVWDELKENTFRNKLTRTGSTLPNAGLLFDAMGSIPILSSLVTMANERGQYELERQMLEWRGKPKPNDFHLSKTTMLLAAIDIIPILGKARAAVGAIKSGGSVVKALHAQPNAITELGQLIEQVLIEHAKTPATKEELLKLVGVLRPVKNELAKNEIIGAKVFDLFYSSGRRSEANTILDLLSIGPEDKARLLVIAEKNASLAARASGIVAGKITISTDEAIKAFINLANGPNIIEAVDRALLQADSTLDKVKLLVVKRNFSFRLGEHGDFKAIEAQLASLIENDTKAGQFYRLEKAAQSFLANPTAGPSITEMLSNTANKGPIMIKLDSFLSNRSEVLKALGEEDFYAAIRLGFRRTIPGGNGFEVGRKTLTLAIYCFH